MEEKVFLLLKKKNFCKSFCLFVLTAVVVSECTDGREQKFKGFVLYCSDQRSELKCIRFYCHGAAVTTFRQKHKAGLHML